MDKEKLINVDLSGYSEKEMDKATEDKFGTGVINKASGNIFDPQKKSKKNQKTQVK